MALVLVMVVLATAWRLLPARAGGGPSSPGPGSTADDDYDIRTDSGPATGGADEHAQWHDDPFAEPGADDADYDDPFAEDNAMLPRKRLR